MDKDRLFHLLSSNDAPDLLEATELHHICNELSTKINGLVVQNPQQPDLDIQPHFRALEEQLNDLMAVLSPIRRVPLELVAEILTISLPETSGRAGRAALIEACLVCKGWRAAALSKHVLWAHLELDLGHSPYDKVVSWLGRSGNLPKALHISSSGTLSPTYAENVGKLLTCGPTLDRFYLSMRRTFEWINILQYLGRTPPANRTWNSLRSLGLRFNGGGQWNDPPFAQLPHAESFQLYLPPMENAFSTTGSCARTRLSFRPEFLQNLTDFRIHFDWPPDPIVAILERCVNLEKLHLGFESIPLLPFEEWPVFQFPRLKILHFEGLTSLGPLDLIRAPVLQNLHLDFHIKTYYTSEQLYLDDSEIKEIWKAFVQRHDGLTSLYIHDVIFDSAAFRAMFSLSNPLPHLAHLTLDRVTWDGKRTRVHHWHILFSTRVLLRYVHIFPCLESVSLLRFDGDFLELDALLEFAEEQERARTEKGGQLTGLRDGSPGSIRDFKLTYHAKAGSDSIAVEHSPEIQARIDSLNRGGTSVRVGPKYE